MIGAPVLLKVRGWAAEVIVQGSHRRLVAAGQRGGAMTAVPLHAVAEPTSSGVAGMDGIARLATRLTGAETVVVALGEGDVRRVLSVAGPDPDGSRAAGTRAADVTAALTDRRGERYGTLALFGCAPSDDDARDLLDDLVGCAVAFLDLRRAAADLARCETNDALTGLANRRAMEQLIGAAITRAERGLGTPSVLVVDLDGFAEVNRARGTEAGDGVLRGVADCLLRVARSVDSVARIGPDEFVVLLEHTGGPGAVAALNRFRAALNEGTWDDSSVPVGASLGMATYRPGDSVASMIARADAEMFADKARRTA
jgi:diguanylate cyclase (GGDEF)-like protein